MILKYLTGDRPNCNRKMLLCRAESWPEMWQMFCYWTWHRCHSVLRH